MSKKAFVIEIHREVSYLSSVSIYIEANSESEARDLALKYAPDIDVDRWSDDGGTDMETYQISFAEQFDLEEWGDDSDIIFYNRDEE